MSTRADNAAAVHKAHDEGVLFAHMFEFNKDEIFGYKDERSGNQVFEAKLPLLARVFNGEDGAHYKGAYWPVDAAPEGYRGLATTALKKDVEVPVWDLLNGVGLLFDGNHKEFTPLHVSSKDAYSHFEGPKLRIQVPETEEFRRMAEIQGFKAGNDRDWEEPKIDMSDPAAVKTHSAKARAALPVLWETIKAMSWDAYCKMNGHTQGAIGVNEVTSIAHLRSMAGVVVSEVPKNCNSDLDRAREFTDRAELAGKVSAWFHANYGGLFKEPPPVFSYDPDRKGQQFIELTQEQLANRGFLMKLYEQQHPAKRKLD
jgi:hypothetical protein